MVDYAVLFHLLFNKPNNYLLFLFQKRKTCKTNVITSLPQLHAFPFKAFTFADK